MKSLFLTLVVLTVPLPSMLASAEPAQPAADKREFSIQLNQKPLTDKDEFALGEPVYMLASTTNDSVDWIKFSKDWVEMIRSVTRDSEPVPRTAFGRKYMPERRLISSGPSVTVPRGDTYSVAIGLHVVFDLTLPGTYTVVLKDYYESSLGGGYHPCSATFQFKVGSTQKGHEWDWIKFPEKNRLLNRYITKGQKEPRPVDKPESPKPRNTEEQTGSEETSSKNTDR